MSFYQLRLDVLSVLSENLERPQPDLVATSVVLEQAKAEPEKMHQLLQMMNSQGLIQTDSDLQYSLITTAGLEYLARVKGG